MLVLCRVALQAIATRSCESYRGPLWASELYIATITEQVARPNFHDELSAGNSLVIMPFQPLRARAAGVMFYGYLLLYI